MLAQRIATGLVLVVGAVAALWAGGLPFAGLAAAAVLLMFVEWAAMLRLPPLGRRLGLGLLGATVLLTWLGDWPSALMLLAGGAGLGGLFLYRMAGGTRRVGLDRTFVTGLLYCGLPGIALVWLRAQPWGFWATLLVMACVWGADIAAFFVGRAVGGPRLAPAISPGKTWSGAVGGLAGACAAAAVIGTVWPGWGGAPGLVRLMPMALGLAVVSILGDLYESRLKRRAGVKDSGTLLPGHGGVLDRLDGLVPAAVLGAGVFWTTGWAG